VIVAHVYESGRGEGHGGYRLVTVFHMISQELRSACTLRLHAMVHIQCALLENGTYRFQKNTSGNLNITLSLSDRRS
jgi:hypothetical protein